MPDGSRKRRHSHNSARRRWYAEHRSRRFSRRFGFTSPSWSARNTLMHRSTVECAA